MVSYRAHISAEQVVLLRSLLGSNPVWVYASRILVDGPMFVATAFFFDLGTSGKKFISVESQLMETPIDRIDYFQFSVSSPTVGELGVPPEIVLLDNMSVIKVRERASIEDVKVQAVTWEGDNETVSYDSEIVLSMANGRSIIIGHPPPIYCGVSLKLVG